MGHAFCLEIPPSPNAGSLMADTFSLHLHSKKIYGEGASRNLILFVKLTGAAMSIHTAGAELFRWFVFLMVCSLSWSLSYGPPVSVKVGSPALLTCSTPCLGDVKWALSKQLEQLPAASCKKEICVEGEAFKNRTKVKQENVSLLLDPAAYTDTGWYICYCSGSVLCDVHLEVFAPITMKASVGEMVTLPCYTRTDKNAAGNGIPIWWEKDGKPVVKLQYGKLSYGSGFEQRASVSASRYKDGDLSLDLTWFRSSDEGVYRCYHGNKDLGYPEAIILRESSTRLEQPVQPWPSYQ
ncbi:hypothetical protein AOLI_G00290470 [Acnodon oligacanthus]